LAVTIPLTLLTIVIWRLWWLWQERSYQKDVKEAVGAAEDVDRTSLPGDRLDRADSDIDASSIIWPDLSTSRRRRIDGIF
jgi:hypothetical protein